jgi:hypothetical protein
MTVHLFAEDGSPVAEITLPSEYSHGGDWPQVIVYESRTFIYEDGTGDHYNEASGVYVYSRLAV